MGSTGINSVVSEYVPWRKGIAWWVVLVQGIVLAVIGGLAFWRTDISTNVILIGLGVYLIVAALWTVVQAMRGREYGLSVFNLLAAGGGLVAGIGVLMPFILNGRPNLTADDLEIVRLTSLVTFGVALLAVGLLWVLSAFVEKPEGGIVFVTIIRGVLFLALGGYILFGVATQSADIVYWIAIAALIVGVLLILYSLLLNRQQARTNPA